ncbi:uncharacterized protein CEXT_169671 [Caerostris extrusa]|uniref:Cyclic nucleotide phosphodiesterase catalytic domain-containing protein n=1 Tax=Caerostris extrusa TaxID=172846 RepID=A0AAV4XLR6_CAEEX|nr:uncharacterized protein CEXT_169671 [Caerostris extrusa]
MSNVEQNQYYIALAYKMQYVILVVPPVAINVSNSMWPKHSFASSFGAQTATYIQPVNMFQHLFCAWYFHDCDSHQLRNEVSLYIQDCLDGIPGFYNIMHRNCRTLDDEGQNGKKNLDGEEMQLIDDIKHYYNLNDKRQDLAYCAVKVIGSSMKAMNEYFKKDIVLSNYGKMSKLLIVGFIITPYILAARVKLTRTQVDLWEMEDLLDESTAKEHNFIGPLSLLQESKQKLPDVEVQLISSKSNPTLINAAKSVEDPLKIISYFARGKACNIVIGKVKNAPTYQVDYGVQFALNMEAKTLNASASLDITELDNCIVKRIGKYWFVYLKEMLQIDGFFSSCVKPCPFDDPIKL